MKKRLIIMGSAPCLETDMIGLLKGTQECSLYDFTAVGLDVADRYLGRIEHCATYHPAELEEFRTRREKAGGNLDYISHSHEDRPKCPGKNIMYPVDRVWPYEKPSGSSAMLGVEVGIGLGYEKIIIAGVVLEEKKYVRFQTGWKIRFDGRKEDYANELKCGTFTEKVINSLKDQKDKVRAMSGYPRELLGAPTEEWLNDE